jgi:hypothetical protein
MMVYGDMVSINGTAAKNVMNMKKRRPFCK